MNSICNVDNDDEYQTIQYGMELLLETIFKLIFVMLLGIFLERGFETLIIISVFCGLRSQAGGKHAKSNFGCSACMVLMWGASLLGYLYFKISDIVLFNVFVFSLYIIISYVPRTRYIEYFSKETICKKKVYAVFLLTVFIFISFININIRGLFVYPIILEVISLLPDNKFSLGG